MCKLILREELGRRSAAGGSVQEEVIGGAWQEGYGRRIWAGRSFSRRLAPGIWMINPYVMEYLIAIIIFIATRGTHGSNKV